MSANHLLQQGKALISAWSQGESQPQADRLDVSLSPSDLVDAVRMLAEEEWGYLAAITGLDPKDESGHLESLYHFANGPAVLTLRVAVSSESPEVPSIAGILPAARIFEQELREMLGMTIRDPIGGMVLYERHLFLPDDWPAGVFPLRKSFQFLEAPAPTME